MRTPGGGGAAFIVDTHEDASGDGLEPLLVREPLERFLDACGLGEGPLVADPLGDGHSNPTFLIRRGEVEMVLRRPPRPPLPPSAHDVLREARLLRAVDRHIRTPRVLAVCADLDVIGAPFFIMEKVEGHVMGADVPPALDTPHERSRIGDEFVQALVEIHGVAWERCGLEGFGRPSGYLERQLRRFDGLWKVNRMRSIPAVERTGRWLAANRPEQKHSTIVHGDYRLGNTMFSTRAPAELLAVLDWEMATIGDPLADVGYLVATWPTDGDDGSLFALSRTVTLPGFPSRAELIASYEQRSGRSMGDARWYAALALWKSAVFLEGSYRRYLAGTADDPFFAGLAEGVPDLAERAWALACGEPL